MGKADFGVGVTRQACVILDRAPIAWLGPKEERFDMAVLTSLRDLFIMLYDTIMVRIQHTVCSCIL